MALDASLYQERRSETILLPVRGIGIVIALPICDMSDALYGKEPMQQREATHEP